MSDEQTRSTIEEKIVSAIRRGHVHMRPRWHFAIKTALILAAFLLACFTVVYIFSYLIFLSHLTGADMAPTFGYRGWCAFFTSLPWLLIGILIIFIVILEILMRRFAFVYRWSMLLLAIAIILVVFAVGFIVAATPFHGKFGSFARERELPLASGFYRFFESRDIDDIHRGRVEIIKDSGFDLLTRHNEILNIVVTQKTRLPTRIILVGDTVVVFGDRDGGSIEAFGVQWVKN